MINDPSVHVRPRDRSSQSNGNPSLTSKLDPNKVHVHRVDRSTIPSLDSLANESPSNKSSGSQQFNRSSVSIQRIQRSSDISNNSTGLTNRKNSDLIDLNSSLTLSASDGSRNSFDPSLNSMPSNYPTVRISKVSRTYGPQPIGGPYPPVPHDTNQVAHNP